MLVSVKSTYCIAPSYRHNTYLYEENNMLQPTPDHHKNMWCPVVPCGQFLDDFIDDFGFAVARIHLFSGYLFTLKQRGNSVLAIIGAHPPKLLD